MSLDNRRRIVRRLLDESKPADAQAVYYALYHPDEKTRIIADSNDPSSIQGYICLSRTGIDLFRPFVTLRLPPAATHRGPDPAAGAALIQKAIATEMPVIISAPADYAPLLGALFLITKEEQVKLLMLDQGRFRPIINVLVSRSEAYDGLPRFVIRQNDQNNSAEPAETIASAGLNWQSAHFAEIYVHTKANRRRQGFGRSVVAAAVRHVLESGRSPLYLVNAYNQPSLQLAESVGFVDLGITFMLAEGTLRAG